MKSLISKVNSHILEDFPKFILIMAIGVIFSVLIMEHFFGLTPCKLCEMQRIPYYMIIGMGLSNLALKQAYNRFFVILAVLALFSAAVLAFYHAGIEYGVFDNIFSCEAGKSGFTDVADLKSSLMGKISVPCDKPAFKFIFTLSGWNFFLSAALGILGIMYILSGKKRG